MIVLVVFHIRSQTVINMYLLWKFKYRGYGYFCTSAPWDEQSKVKVQPRSSRDLKKAGSGSKVKWEKVILVLRTIKVVLVEST